MRMEREVSRVPGAQLLMGAAVAAGWRSWFSRSFWLGRQVPADRRYERLGAACLAGSESWALQASSASSCFLTTAFVDVLAVIAGRLIVAQKMDFVHLCERDGR